MFIFLCFPFNILRLSVFNNCSYVYILLSLLNVSEDTHKYIQKQGWMCSRVLLMLIWKQEIHDQMPEKQSKYKHDKRGHV